MSILRLPNMSSVTSAGQPAVSEQTFFLYTVKAERHKKHRFYLGAVESFLRGSVKTTVFLIDHQGTGSMGQFWLEIIVISLIPSSPK